MKYYIGIDLGGMSAKGAIFGEDGASDCEKIGGNAARGRV